MFRKLFLLAGVCFLLGVSSLNLPELGNLDALLKHKNNEQLSQLADVIANSFELEYFNHLKTNQESPQFQKLCQDLSKSHSGREMFLNQISELGVADQFFLCTTCRATVNVVARTYKDPEGELHGDNREKDTKYIILDICRRLNIQTQEVCGAVFDFNWPILEYIIENSISDARSLCGSLPIRFCKVKQPEYDWTLKIDESGEEITSSKHEVPQKTANDHTILHLTDIHYDPLYQPGSLAECEEILCCQRDKEIVEGTSAAAGYWSDYRVCDSPWHMITNAMEHIKSTHTHIDFIYNTGDIVDHMIWETSKEKNSLMLTKVNEYLKEMFPNIPVYSCVGNHEPHPLNVFGPNNVPDDINVKWLYQQLWDQWSKWLPEDTKETILAGGYYTVSPKAGFRIISLNNNDCYIFNWWIYYDGSSVKPQLEWLHDTLLAAEQNKEYVHILAHIPSGDTDCWPLWSREYNRIIHRFRHTISGIFNGHTHSDEINVHYTDQGHAVGISWNGGSLTSYTYKNPNYVVYEVEPNTMQIVDKESWIFNLTAANIQGMNVKPNWYREHKFTEEYELSDLSPAGLDAWLDRMADEPKLLRKYWRNKVTSADPKITAGCDHKCLRKVICRLATTVNNQKERCQELRERLQIALDNEIIDPEDDGASTVFVSQMTFILCLLLLFKNLT